MNPILINKLRVLSSFCFFGTVFLLLGYSVGSAVGLTVVAVFYSLLILLTFLKADNVVLGLVGAEYLQGKQASAVYALVREVARRAGVQTPAIYVFDARWP